MAWLSLFLTHVGIERAYCHSDPAVSTEAFPGKKGKVRIKQRS